MNLALLRTTLAVLSALNFVAPTLFSGSPVAAPPPAVNTANPRSDEGEWVVPLPVSLELVRPFDPPAQRWLAGHRGVDLRAPTGTEVFAAGPGRVVFAGHLVDRPLVSVEHPGGIRLTYEPVLPTVSVGDQVAAGDILGTVAGGHPGETLHWGARWGRSDYVDPLGLLLGPVVLKPWD